jgi:hypothetical protein
MLENRRKSTDTNHIYVWIQEELPNKFYSINQEDIETLEDLDIVGKMTSETKEV